MSHPGEKERRKARRAQRDLARLREREGRNKKKKYKFNDKHFPGYDPEIHSNLYDYI